MKLTVQPGRKHGQRKVLLERNLQFEDIELAEKGVIVKVTAADIYTAGATQRFSIALSRDEIDLLLSSVVPPDGPAKLTEHERGNGHPAPENANRQMASLSGSRPPDR